MIGYARWGSSSRLTGPKKVLPGMTQIYMAGKMGVPSKKRKGHFKQSTRSIAGPVQNIPQPPADCGYSENNYENAPRITERGNDPSSWEGYNANEWNGREGWSVWGDWSEVGYGEYNTKSGKQPIGTKEDGKTHGKKNSKLPTESYKPRISVDPPSKEEDIRRPPMK